MQKNCYIGACLGLGAQIGECQNGPIQLFQSPYFREKSTKILSSHSNACTDTLSLEQRMDEITAMNRAISHLIVEAYASGERPFVVGGDHSIAVGTWNGVKRAVNDDIGLIWIDAHMDSHTFETSPSMAPHGMPLAGLLGYGDARLSELHFADRVLKPEHVCLVGTRSYEEGEAALLKRLGVRVITIEEVVSRGMASCISEAISIAEKASGGFGVSFDLDVFDPSVAPGVGSLEADGAAIDDVFSSLPRIFSHPDFLTLELVEYNPERDIDGVTKDLAINLLTLMDLSLRETFQGVASNSASA